MSGRQRLGARRNTKQLKRASDQPPSFVGWRTSDAEENERRRWRGRTEILSAQALEATDPFFGCYRVRSVAGSSYVVEIRSLKAPENSCGCRDHAVNGLGTCKHIEGTLYALRRGRVRQFDQATRQGCPWAEIYLARQGEPQVRLLRPNDTTLAARLGEHFQVWFSDQGDLRGDPLETLPAIERAIATLPPALRSQMRLSRHLKPWLLERQQRETRRLERQRFLQKIDRGAASLDVLRSPLLPYQHDGMLHLAFAERALLADDMGLGKTIQAIAACALLRQQRGIERVLVVAPASLKVEWQEQIARFAALPVQLIEGDRASRLRLYQQPAFFYLANYEQILSDGPDLNRLLRPDVVILDEAQRIKNWQTKTAHAVKGLISRYAFVLTGTPLENRIDESIRSSNISIPAYSGRCSASIGNSISWTTAAARSAIATSTSCIAGCNR